MNKSDKNQTAFFFSIHESHLFTKGKIKVNWAFQTAGSTTFFSSVLLLLSLIFLVSSSYAGTYYYRNENGTPIYTNIPPVKTGYKRIILTEPTYRSSPKSLLGSTKYSKKYDYQIQNTATWYGVDPYLVKAVIKVESNFNSDAVSPKGAIGVMQLMPGTAKDQGVNNPFDPLDNIKGGVKYLNRLMKMFNGNLELALAGYNAGQNAVVKYGYKIPPYAETVSYVKKVLFHYNNLKEDSSKVRSEESNKPRISSKGLSETHSTGESKQNSPRNGNLAAKKTADKPKGSQKETELYDEDIEGGILLASANETLTLGTGRINDSTGIALKALSERERFTVQVASFPDVQQAEELKKHLKSKLYPAFIQKVELPDKGTWYRVRVGNFKTKKEATIYGNAIKNTELAVESVLVVMSNKQSD
ncbi:MAG TPA: lytic transglycosylase domain-containing protein [Thermodesulfobacteriota bacterium]|nr:lytic transglycosylase domain-containing protein [Thermodesulfobacteriota bacterium]